MQHAVKSSPMDVVEEYFWGKIALRVRGLQARGITLSSWLSKICNHFGEIDSGSRKSLTLIKQKWSFFGEKHPLRANVHKCFPKPHMRTRKHVFLCKFREIWPTGSRWNRALFNGQKKQQNFGSCSRSRFCADRAQNLSGTAPNNILGVPQISSKSVHFRRSYSRTREHRSNAPQSICNTRRSFSFFAE